MNKLATNDTTEPRTGCRHCEWGRPDKCVRIPREFDVLERARIYNHEDAEGTYRLVDCPLDQPQIRKPPKCGRCGDCGDCATCPTCDGYGCQVCGWNGWIENITEGGRA